MTSTVVHSSGTVVATCSGQRSLNQLEGDDGSDGQSDSSSSSDDSDSDSESAFSATRDSSSTSSQPTLRTPDNSIKVWKL